EAEEEYQHSYQEVETAAINDLKAENAPNFDFARCSALPRAQQDEMVNQYILDRMRNDANVRRKHDAVFRETSVVEVALDLGIVQVSRGRSMNDPAARKAEFERAEATFLAIQEAAALRGEAWFAKMKRGEVYFWMGRQADGKKLFEELLKEENRNTEVL